MAFNLIHARDRLWQSQGFGSILLPVNSALHELPCDMLQLGARLARERRSVIVVLLFTEIPLWEEMDVELPEVDGRVLEMAKQAHIVAGGYGVGVRVVAPRTRQPAELILAEAARRRAELVILGATGHGRDAVAALLHDSVAQRVAEQPGLRTMFVRPPRVAA